MVHRSKGFTLVELMITVVVVAVGVALAVPNWDNVVQKRKTTGGAEEIAAFLASVQSEAIKRNERVAVTVKRNVAGTTWCLGAMIKTNDGDHCDCASSTPAAANYCDFNPDGAGTPQLISSAGFDKFTMNAAAVQGVDGGAEFHFNFDPVRGVKTTDLGTVDSNTHDISVLSENDHYALQVDVSVTGRVRLCNPDLSRKVPGYKSCISLVIVPIPPPL